MSLGFTESSWLQYEGSLKRVLLLAAFVTFAVWETFRPRRRLVAPAGRRWIHHAILFLLCNSPFHWIFPLTAVMVASAASTSRFGLLNQEIIPLGVRFALGVLLLDLVHYAQHRLYHSFPVLWRIHQVHHTDPDIDWSTGLLFHPAEFLLTQASYLAMIVAVAPPPAAVLGFELANLVVNFFEHANVAIPQWLDTRLRRFLITPDMHRIHHSAELAEQNTNFGTIFPWWDRLFGTYAQQPAAGQEKMRIGLPAISGQRGLSLPGLLALPFRNTVAAAGAALPHHPEGLPRTEPRA